jgi:methylenetetrahydrofolate--tRNA-(uracil-5-)-methyltransferase
LQLRHENREGTMVNLVGCQTKLKYGEQDRVFRLIPALKDAVFLRYGSMHRNTFVNAPRVLNEDLSLKANPHVHLAGQITGVEGYIESIACGLWASRIVIAAYQQNILTPPPRETELGGLLAHLRTETDNFQPMKANFGLMPPLAERVPKRQRKEAYAERARTVWQQWRQDMQL